MARFNEILTGRHNRFMQKLFQLKGGPPAPQLSSDLQMVHPIFHGAENRYLESWHRFGFSQVVTAVAAINSTTRLRNPLTSNVVAVLERVSVGEAAQADRLNLGMTVTNADLVVIATSAANRLDLRQQSQGPTLVVSNSDATHPGSLINSLLGLAIANTMYEFVFDDDGEIPLLPGQAVDLWSATVNIALTVSVVWRERALEEAERF